MVSRGWVLCSNSVAGVLLGEGWFGADCKHNARKLWNCFWYGNRENLWRLNGKI